MYVAVDKGPINAQHVLILPIEHRSSSLDLSPAAFTELERYLSALRTCYAAKVGMLFAGTVRVQPAKQEQSLNQLLLVECTIQGLAFCRAWSCWRLSGTCISKRKGGTTCSSTCSPFPLQQPSEQLPHSSLLPRRSACPSSKSAGLTRCVLVAAEVNSMQQWRSALSRASCLW